VGQAVFGYVHWEDGKLPSSITDFVYVFAAVSPPQSLLGGISTHDLSLR
jgi:hypothetical protein